MFGVILPWVAASAVALIAVVLRRNRPLLVLALGLALGAIAYVALGLAWNLFDDPSSMSGGN